MFEEEAAKIDKVTKKSGIKSIEYLLQVPDVIESVGFKGPSVVMHVYMKCVQKFMQLRSLGSSE